MDRRQFLRTAAFGAATFGGAVRMLNAAPVAKADRPNIVIIITDDQGWGDTGYSGHSPVKTPVLDQIAATGVRFDRFYAAHPVCSPTRGSVVTGRHPNRFGCFLYNYSLRPEEVTLAEAVKGAGYATGHFGKWHLGPAKAGSPVNPGASGFDEWLSHDNFFDLNPSFSRNGAPSEPFEGESSEIVAGEAMKFIGKSVAKKKPFFAMVCFGSPHVPLKALAADRKPYADQSTRMQHYLGEITALDRAVGMLRKGLRARGVADNTLLWFFSDNGPLRNTGSTGGLRGNKATLWEGGVRVPGLIEWPAKVRKPMTTSMPCSTLDVYPTIVDILGIDVPGQVKPLDGISLVPLLAGRMKSRPKPMGFWKYPLGGEKGNGPWLPDEAQAGQWRKFSNFKHPTPRTAGFGGHAAWTGNRYKLHAIDGKHELYDLIADPAESKDLAAAKPAIVAKMKADLHAWQASVERSLAGMDYPAKRK